MAKAPGYIPSTKAGLTKKAGYFIVDKNTGTMVDRRLFDVTYRDSGLMVSKDEQKGDYTVTAGWTAETIDSKDNPLKRSALKSALGLRFADETVSSWRRAEDVSDEEILEKVSKRFGISGGGSSFGGYSYKGGKNPSFKLDRFAEDLSGDPERDSKEFKGKQLADLVRESYGLKSGVRTLPFKFPRLSPNEIAFEIPPKDMWIFDQTEDLKPNGAEYQSLREHLIRDYVREYYEANNNKNWNDQGPFKHSVQESVSNNSGSWRVPDFETLGLFNSVVADDSSFSDAVDDWDYHFPSETDPTPRKPIIAAPYRVEVQWATETRYWPEDGAEGRSPGKGWLYSDGPHPKKPDERPNSYPAWTLEEAKEIMNSVKQYDPDNVTVMEISDEHLQKWAVLVNRSGDYKLIQDAENREDYRKQIFNGMEDLAELANGFIEDIRVYEMRGDEGKDQFFESASEGEVDFLDLYNDGNFEVKSLDKFGGVMMSSMVDFNLNAEPTDDGKGGGWMLDGKVQDGAPPIKDEVKKVIEEYDAYKANMKDLPYRDPYHQDDPVHSFEALYEANPVGGEKDSTDKKIVRTGYGAELQLPDGHNYPADWDQDDVLDSLEAGNYGRFLPRVFGNDARRLWYSAEPQIHGMPIGELTLNPSVKESNDGWDFTKTWEIKNQGGKYGQPYRIRSNNDFIIKKPPHTSGFATGQIQPDFQHQGWKNGQGPPYPGDAKNKNKPHAFRRIYRDARGRDLEYTSNNTNSGLVIWKDQESARQSARIARSRGWLIRTVPIGPKTKRRWVNLGNNKLLKMKGVLKKNQPQYWRKKQ